MCSWYVHGGALVAVGTATVGYLHQGRNWVVCQQVGDDYGPFGGGTPNCNGAHGSPPAYSGLWGSPPAPPPAPVDADRDGVSPPADCDDTNSRVDPGAPEVVGDGIDQDCNGADAAGRISGTFRFTWRVSHRWTKVTGLSVSEAPPGATVSVTCKGRHKHCPKARTFTVSAKGKASMRRMFKHRVRAGARIEVVLSAPNTIAKIKRYTLRSGKPPRTRTLCAPPGARPAAC
jgi:hypothetical protein